MGGGYGSIQPVLNNNKNLLRERDYLNGVSSSSTDVKLEFDKVSEEKLHQIKESIQIRSKKERIKSRLKSTILFIICLFISIYLVVEVFAGWIPL
ncbi:hypothetical protein ACOSP6_04680 [Tenacibaculum sp. MEBiC06402]|uniref:hypothetical protein n=1 Tax=unclassified Tenacibaculum TaxID=2635139 RepID=UPI003B9C8C66